MLFFKIKHKVSSIFSADKLLVRQNLGKQVTVDVNSVNGKLRKSHFHLSYRKLTASCLNNELAYHRIIVRRNKIILKYSCIKTDKRTARYMQTLNSSATRSETVLRVFCINTALNNISVCKNAVLGSCKFSACRNYYLPYIEQHTSLKFGRKCRVMEVGCGIGGILSIFAAMGATVTGIDIHKPSIETAKTLFAERGLKGTFICSDIFDYSDTQPYDLIILHDALEHIPEKERLMLHLKSFLKADGLLYLGFPAWQMPFGGHQQMAKNRIIANCPYIHLLPRPLFRFVFRACGEKESTVKCFFEIRDTRITIEGFHKLVTATGLRIVNQRLYFINPNYQVKFGLKPRILSPVIGKIPYVRNFFTTTCYYLLAKQEEAN